MYRGPDTGIKFRYTVVSGKILLDVYRILFRFFEIRETGVKTFERELKSCFTALTSGVFTSRQPGLLKSMGTLTIVFPFHSLILMFKLATIRYPIYPVSGKLLSG